jgi:poly-D-alanine transfer protein DltD
MVDMYTVKKYIEEFKKTNYKFRYLFFNKEVALWMGMDDTHNKTIGFKPMNIIAKHLNNSPHFVLNEMTKVVLNEMTKGPITQAAVGDLLEFVTECGIKAYYAKKNDKEAAKLQQITFLNELYLVADKQELYLVSTNHYESEISAKASVDTLPEKQEGYNPLAIMSDEQGYMMDFRDSD